MSSGAAVGHRSVALVHAGIDPGDRHARAGLIDPDVVAQVSLGGGRQAQDSCGEPAGDDAGKSELLIPFPGPNIVFNSGVVAVKATPLRGRPAVEPLLPRVKMRAKFDSLTHPKMRA
jgi:hypothetical protein